MNSIGLEYLSAVMLETPDIFIGASSKHLFHSSAEKQVHNYLLDFLTDHGKFPTPQTLTLETGVGLPVTIEPASYYLQHLRRRHVFRSLQRASEEAGPYMTGKGIDPDKALEIISDTVYQLSLTEGGAQIFDFRDAKSVVISTLAQQVTMGGMLGIELGWPYLDNMTGGILAGDLFSIVSRPGKGKTWMMVYASWRAWLAGYTPLLLTMEMPAVQIYQRLASLHSHTPAMALKIGQLTSNQEWKLKEDLEALKGAEKPFWIIDGQMNAGIDDTIRLTSRLKPDILFVDGAYMLKHPNKNLRRSDRVSEVCDSLKTLASTMPIPVVATWQLNREATKLKDTETLGTEHIAESDNISRLSSVMMALLNDKTPDSIHTREVFLVKGRGGEMGSWKINWDFFGMDFTQRKSEKDTSDLKYV